MLLNSHGSPDGPDSSGNGSHHEHCFERHEQNRSTMSWPESGTAQFRPARYEECMKQLKQKRESRNTPKAKLRE
jgi:hypothetical protein